VAAAQGSVKNFGFELALCADAILESDASFSFWTQENLFPPMGGGLTEIALHAYALGENVPGYDVVPFLKRVYSLLYLGGICSGVDEAVKRGIPLPDARNCAAVELLDRAKAKALSLSKEGRRPYPKDRGIVASGTTGAAALEIIAINLHRGGFISKDLLNLGEGVAWVLCGGDVPKGTPVTEAQMLKCERKAFTRACQRLARKEEVA
jgi:3-hydroxyacyl-CoA dehydrogenase